jgi:hypothetical protein
MRRAATAPAHPEASYFTPETAHRYGRLAEDAALVAALGVDMDPEPAPGVRGVALDHEEALRGEWNVVALGPTSAPPSSPATSATTGPTASAASTSPSPTTANSSPRWRGR